MGVGVGGLVSVLGKKILNYFYFIRLVMGIYMVFEVCCDYDCDLARVFLCSVRVKI